MTASCHGRLVATPLTDPDQEILGHTYIGPSYRIDPHELQYGTGSIRHRHHPWRNDADYRPSPFQRHPAKCEQLWDHNYSGVRMDVFLYESEQLGISQTALHLELNRKANEPVVRSLQRVGLNIQKKLSQPKQKAKKRVEPRDPIVWTLDRDREGKKSIMDISELNNLDLCQKIVTSDSPIVVDLEIGSMTEDIGKMQLSLCFEACLPTVTSVQTFDDFNARLFLEIPLTVSVETLYATHSQVEWYIDSSVDKVTIESNGVHTYVPTNKTLVGKNVSILVKPIVMENDEVLHEGSGAEHAFRFEGEIESRPHNAILNLRCSWLDQGRRHGFRFLTYNILADQNAFSMTDGSPFYPYVSKETLEKRRRMPLILHEIVSYSADIICLQEVDEAVFRSLFLPTFKSLGFQGFYTGKVKDGTREGCAVFWSLRKFLPVDDSEHLSVPIRGLVPMLDVPGKDEHSHVSDGAIHGLLCHSPALRDVLCNKLGHVLQLVRLQQRNEVSQTPLWVANTHLFYHPLASHIRLIQAYLLSKRVAIALDERPGALIVTGDFNSSLRNAAGKLLLDRTVPKNFRDTSTHLNSFRWEKEDPSEPVDVENRKEQKPKECPSIGLGDNFPTLRSAILPEPEFTHFVDGFSGTLDHILMSSTIQCSSYAPMPKRSDVTAKVAMPSPELPSDHVCLVCDMDLLPSSPVENRGESE